MTASPRTPEAHQKLLDRLRAGNERFVQNVRSIDALTTQTRRDALVAGQQPFAIVLSCSDSRVPSELVFDCGLGDLFIVRVAGNVVAPSIVGSVEFAAATFGTALVVVMGHTRCGAVAATLDTLKTGGAPASDNIRDIVERITPAVTELHQMRPTPPDLLRAAIRANVRASVQHLSHGSRILEQLRGDGALTVVGAEYELETGRVHFLDGDGARGSGAVAG